MGHIRDIDLTIVMMRGGVLFFETIPEEAKKLIEKATPKIKKAPSDKILVRMMETRIRKIYESVKSHNNSIRENEKVWNGNSGLTGTVPDFRTIQSIRSYLTDVRLAYADYELSRILKDLEKNVFCKSELTDQLVSDAMDLVIPSMVMEQ